MNVRIPEMNITRGSFVVQWDAVEDFFTVNYNVSWYEEDGINGTTNVNGLSHTVTGLTNSTSYSVTVAAINTCCGAGPVSNAMAMTNERPTTPPPTSPTSSSPTTPGNIYCYVHNYSISFSLLSTYCMYIIIYVHM